MSSLPKIRKSLPIRLESRTTFFGGAGATLYARILWLIFEQISRKDFRTALDLTEYLLDIFPEEERVRIEKAITEVDIDKEVEELIPADLPPERYKRVKATLRARLKLRYLLRFSSRWINQAMFLRGPAQLELKE